MTTKDDIVEAWDKAQTAFKAMIDAGTYGDPNAPETQAYTEAEREVDHRLAEARWEWRENYGDLKEDALSDHHVYPNGVGQ